MPVLVSHDKRGSKPCPMMTGSVESKKRSPMELGKHADEPREPKVREELDALAVPSLRARLPRVRAVTMKPALRSRPVVMAFVF